MKNIWLLALVALLFTSPVFAADASPTLTLGNPNAPIQIDEYASLGCPHCGMFDMNTLPQLKTNYIDTGKVKLIYHHFPLDKASIDAALLVHCVPPAQAWDAINLLFFQQDHWAHEMDYDAKLVGFGQMLGLTEPAIKACLNNTKMSDAILQGRINAGKKLEIQGTPTLVFNKGAARLVGFQSYDQVVAVLNKL